MQLNGEGSMGFVETGSLVAAIEASDAMVKAARVRLATVHKPGGGRVCVFVYGDLASCQAAVSAGKHAAERCGSYLQSHVLARPDTNSEALWTEHIPDMLQRKQLRVKRKNEPENGAEGLREESGDGAASGRRRTQKTGKKR